MSGVGVEGMGEEGQGKGEMGGLECGTGEKGEFNWERWEGGEVVFEGTSVSVGADENADGLQALRRWIEDL
jgi:signal recognition particle receptor subunit beta